MLEPWYRPTLEELRARERTHRRVADDLNRSGTSLTLLLGRAHLHTGDPERGVELVCEAARQGADPERIDRALAEAPGSPEPARCRPGAGEDPTA